MASEVDICNIALGHLGDSGTIASLNPPEGSAQAEHCARYYPLARDELLSVHPWGFSTRREPLAQMATPPVGWQYSYALPKDTLTVLAVLHPDEPDPGIGVLPFDTNLYVTESGANGNQLIYCNIEQAVVLATFRVTSTNRFSSLFVSALTWHLASKLAGPVIKGAEGSAESKRCAQMAQAYLGQARDQDANQRRVKHAHVPPWIAARNGSWSR